jgi:hypothetical protein
MSVETIASRVRPPLPRSRIPRTGALPTGPRPRFEPLVRVLVPFLAADVGFVNLDDAAQLPPIPGAGFAQTMQHEPRRLLGDADFLRELEAADALPRRHEQIHRVDPLVQRNMRPLKDGASSHREILPAGVAAVEPALPRRNALALDRRPDTSARSATGGPSRYSRALRHLGSCRKARKRRLLCVQPCAIPL